MRRYAPERYQRFLPERIPASIAARIATFAVGGYGIVQGLVILRSDEARFVSVGYNGVRQFPGAMASWGWAFLMLGIAVVIGMATRHFLVKTIALGLMSASIALFGSGSWNAVLQSPNAGPTGPAIYYLGAFLAGILMAYDVGAGTSDA